MKLALHSDFRDFYDHRFEPHDFCDAVLDRRMGSGMSRYACLQHLERMGLDVPFYGHVRDAHCLPPAENWVAHLEGKHGGKKWLLPARQVSNLPEGTLIVAHIDQLSGPSVSYRLLGIGHERFGLFYESDHPFLSNVSVNRPVEIGEISVADGFLTEPRGMLPPLWAIDFVTWRDSPEFFAVDWNVAPGLCGTPIAERFSADEIVRMITDYVRDSDYARMDSAKQ